MVWKKTQRYMRGWYVTDVINVWGIYNLNRASVRAPRHPTHAIMFSQILVAPSNLIDVPYVMFSERLTWHAILPSP